MAGKRLADWTIEDYTKLHQIVKFKKGRWKNVLKAAKYFGVDRATIRRALAIYPQPPTPWIKKVEPRYVSEWRETEAYKKIVRDYTDPKTKKLTKWGNKIESTGIELFLMFKKDKHYRDPTTLTVRDFEEAWKNPNWIHPETGKIDFHKASALRILMVYAGIDPKPLKQFTTKGLKEEPKKREWYLNDEELKRFIYAINEPDTLLFARIGMESGGRFSSVVLTSTEKISYEHNSINMYEPKLRGRAMPYVDRLFTQKTMEFLRQYIKDFDLIGKLFKWSYKIYEQRFLEAGLRAGLFKYTGKTELKRIVMKGKPTIREIPLTEGKKTSSHLLKHTFVSLSSLHGWGLDDVSEQTGTDPATLKKYYLGVGKAKIKALVLGITDFKPYKQWIEEDIHPHWVARYNQIKPLAYKVNGIKVKT